MPIPRRIENTTVLQDPSVGSHGGHAKCATGLAYSIRSGEQHGLAEEMAIMPDLQSTPLTKQRTVLHQLGVLHCKTSIPHNLLAKSEEIGIIRARQQRRLPVDAPRLLTFHWRIFPKTEIRELSPAA